MYGIAIEIGREPVFACLKLHRYRETFMAARYTILFWATVSFIRAGVSSWVCTYVRVLVIMTVVQGENLREVVLWSLFSLDCNGNFFIFRIVPLNL